MKSPFKASEKTGGYETLRPVSVDEIINMARKLINRRFAKGRALTSPTDSREFLQKKKPKVIYEFLGIKIKQFNARIDASTNSKATDKRYFYQDPKVYQFYSSIEIEGVYTYPDERVGQAFVLTIYGSEMSEGEHERTLSDYQERDDEGQLKYRKVRGELTPIYNVPNFIPQPRAICVRTHPH